MCEIFNNNKCTGCCGLEYDNIDELKKQCETWQKYFGEGEQMKWSAKYDRV